MIEKMNEHLKQIGSHFGTTDGTTFRSIIPGSEKMVILTKRFDSIEEAAAFVFSLKARA